MPPPVDHQKNTCNCLAVVSINRHHIEGARHKGTRPQRKPTLAHRASYLGNIIECCHRVPVGSLLEARIPTDGKSGNSACARRNPIAVHPTHFGNVFLRAGAIGAEAPDVLCINVESRSSTPSCRAHHSVKMSLTHWPLPQGLSSPFTTTRVLENLPWAFVVGARIVSPPMRQYLVLLANTYIPNSHAHASALLAYED